MAISVLICHLACSGLVVAYLARVHEHRLINLKTWPIGEWRSLADGYLRHVQAQADSDRKKTMFFLGSSVTYGFPYKADVGFTKYLSEHSPEYRIANLGIVGVGMQGVTEVFECPLTNLRHADILIVEIPLVNSVSSLRSSANGPTSPPCATSPLAATGFWGLTLKRPLGAGWVRSLWEETVRPDHGGKTSIVQVPPDFFADSKRFSMLENQYRQALFEYLGVMSKLGKKVFVYVSPIYLPGVKSAGGDAASVQRQINLSHELCRLHEGIVCLDASPFFFKGEMYSNLTHFNAAGNHDFGLWLEKEIRQTLQ